MTETAEEISLVWCRFALLDFGVAPQVLISLSDGVVVAIERDVTDPPPHAVRLDGLTLPGFANVHSHAFHRALRSRTHRQAGDFWTWRTQMYAVAAELTPQNYYDLARATFAEMLLAGYTAVGEFHYVHHQQDGAAYDDANAMGTALIRAAIDAGIRITLLDACYLRGGHGRQVSPEQRRFCDGTVSAWADRVGQLAASVSHDAHPLVAVGAAIHSVRAVDAPSVAIVARFAHDNGLPLHAHVSEQIGENDEAMEEFRCTPTELLAQQGALSARFTAIHATNLTDTDIDLLATAVCSVCFCPTTERDLADGIGPSAELASAGVPLTVGSDQHAVIDPFEEMRAIELNERLRSMQRGNHTAASLLRAGTSNGYRSLGWASGGTIAVGALADLTSICLDSVRLAGVQPGDLLDAAVFAAAAADVDTVVVGGRVVVRNGTHVSLDVADELRRSIAAVTVGAVSDGHG